MSELQEYVGELPNISGSEAIIDQAIKESQGKTIFLNESGIDFGSIRSAVAVALHMQ